MTGAAYGRNDQGPEAEWRERSRVYLKEKLRQTSSEEEKPLPELYQGEQKEGEETW